MLLIAFTMYWLNIADSSSNYQIFMSKTVNPIFAKSFLIESNQAINDVYQCLNLCNKNENCLVVTFDAIDNLNAICSLFNSSLVSIPQYTNTSVSTILYKKLGKFIYQ